jgi:hypothetical protein
MLPSSISDGGLCHLIEKLKLVQEPVSMAKLRLQSEVANGRWKAWSSGSCGFLSDREMEGPLLQASKVMHVILSRRCRGMSCELAGGNSGHSLQPECVF